eukprot:1192447-Prorocentrum_minimum.AAC.1
MSRGSSFFSFSHFVCIAGAGSEEAAARTTEPPPPETDLLDGGGLVGNPAGVGGFLDGGLADSDLGRRVSGQLPHK